MPTIHVHFQEGFDGDEAIVRLGGRSERLADLRTRHQIGRAGRLDLESQPGPVEIEVEITNLRLKRTIPVQVPADGDAHVGISIENRREISSKVSNEPFRYA